MPQEERRARKEKNMSHNPLVLHSVALFALSMYCLGNWIFLYKYNGNVIMGIYIYIQTHMYMIKRGFTEQRYRDLRDKKDSGHWLLTGDNGVH